MHIHMFEDAKNKYIFDVNKNAILELSDESYEWIKQYGVKRGGPHLDMANTEIRSLLKQGYLSDKRPHKCVHPDTPMVENLLNNKLARVCLQVTQQCNFRCEYCVYSGAYENRLHTQRTMSWDIAKKAIDFLLEHSRDSKVLDVSFYGGEPLLEYELIEKCIDYVLEKTRGKTVTFNMTTNASLLTEEMIKKFVHCNMRLSVSLDGPKEIQDKNRKFVNGKGSFETVYSNLSKIIKKYPELKGNLQFSMVLDPENEVNCINKFILDEQELFENSSVMGDIISEEYRKETLVYSEEFLQDWKYGQFLYMLFLLKRLKSPKYNSKLFMGPFTPLIKFAELTRRKFPELGDEAHHSGPCIPGQIRLFVSADGVFYPCERVNEESQIMKIGDVDNGFDFDKVKYLLNVGKVTEKECSDCFAIRNCTICAAMADGGDHLDKEKKLSACNVTRGNFEEMLKDLCAMKKCGYVVQDKSQNWGF